MKERVLSYDLIKIVAIIAVVIIHVSATNWYQTSIDNDWLINNFINALFHSWAVPLFLMVSGALLLSKNITIKKVFSKYIPRILICLVFWHLLYYFYTNSEFTFNNLGLAIKNMLLSKTYSHLWYLYLLIGIYIILPLISKLVNNLDDKMLLYLLVISGIVSIVLPTINLLFGIDIDYVEPFIVLQFSQYMFYFILGYALNKVKIKTKKNILLILIGFFVVSILVASFSNYMSYKETTRINYSQTYTIFGTICASCLFIFINNKFSNKKNKVINNLGELSFGVYLVHFLVIKVLQRYGIHSNIINPILGNIIVTISVLAISFLISFIISKIPVIKKLIGV